MMTAISSSQAPTKSAALPVPVTSPSAITKTRRKPPKPSSRSTASAGLSQATTPKSTQTASCRCSDVVPYASTPVAKKFTQKKSKKRSKITTPSLTYWSSAYLTIAGASASSPSSSSKTDSKPTVMSSKSTSRNTSRATRFPRTGTSASWYSANPAVSQITSGPKSTHCSSSKHFAYL